MSVTCGFLITLAESLRVPSSVLQAHGGHFEVEEGFDIGTKRGAAMRVARWCGLLVGAKDPSKFHIVRLNLGKKPRLGAGKRR